MKYLILAVLVLAPVCALGQTPRLLIDSSDNQVGGQPPLGDYSVWIGVSRMDRWGGELGFRYKWFGLGIGTPDLSRGEALPDFNDYDIPHSGYRTERFEGGHNGIMLYFFYDVITPLALYGGAGVYWKADILLDRSTATGWYYKNANSPELYGAEFAAALGIQATVFRHVVIGAGGNSVTGFIGHVGVRF